MIDWNKRNHELRVLLFDGFYSRNPQEAVHKIITQEQALIQETRKELIKRIWQEEPDGDWLVITKKFTDKLLLSYK